MFPYFNLRRLNVALLLVTTLFALPLFWRGGVTPSTPTKLDLLAPTFISSAKAQSLDNVTANIATEAGISAYVQTDSPINLADVRGQFRVIEDETDDYIIGSVPVKDYPEWLDAHVYIHKDGWILAYYLKADPSGKIFDWVSYVNTNSATVGTKFDIVIANVLAAVGSSFTEANYYDFRYPNATKMMIAIEWGHEESFQIKLPSSFSYFERSGFTTNDLYVNNVKVLDAPCCEANHYYLTLQATQLPPDQFHAIKVDGVGGMILIYKET